MTDPTPPRFVAPMFRISLILNELSTDADLSSCPFELVSSRRFDDEARRARLGYDTWIGTFFTGRTFDLDEPVDAVLRHIEAHAPWIDELSPGSRRLSLEIDVEGADPGAATVISPHSLQALVGLGLQLGLELEGWS